MAASMRTDKTVLILSLDIPGDAQTAREAVTGKRQDLSLVQPGFQGGEFGRAGRRGQREPSLRGESPRREGSCLTLRTHAFLGDRGQKGH